jgi:hypothetical protein
MKNIIQLLRPYIKASSKYFDSSHEKFFYNIMSILVFSFVYYTIDTTIDNNSFTSKTEKTNLEYGDYLWLSITTNFTIPLGDVYPTTFTAKWIMATQALFFWYITLH